MTRVFALALALALAGCAPAARVQVDDERAVGSGETIVVGRVELVPPLRKDEQHLRGIGTGAYENRIFLLTDERKRTLQGEPGVSDFAGRIEATLGSHFFVQSRSAPFYVVGGVVFLEVGPGMSRAYFPGGLKVALKPGDRAVYIGTLRYHRDEFFEITRVDVVDEYRTAHAEFTRKFGADVLLRKALMAPAK